MLMAGLQNVPVRGPTFSDPMTMKMVGISQTLPYPGKLALRTRAARDDFAASEARFAQTRLDLTRDVRIAYYDLAFADRAMDVVHRNTVLLGSLISVTDARYSVGTGAQADVLRARVEAAQLGEQASALAEQRRADLARLNALLDRPSGTPVEAPSIPTRIARAAVADSANQIHFVSAALGARAADSPLLPLDSLQSLAVAYSPALKVQEAEIGARAAEVELARKAYLPDFDVSLSYGQRQALPGMISAIVSIPVPWQKDRKQDAEVADATARLAVLDAERHDTINMLRGKVAEEESTTEQSRTALALYVKAILPQARAALASATASYQVGRLEFTAVIDAQAALFNYEIAYYRSLTDFAKALASLQRTVGTEVLR